MMGTVNEAAVPLARRPGGAARDLLDPADGRVSCWLCGTYQAVSAMVADGGASCPDVRWYCQDIGGCTSRWTEHGAIRPAARGRLP